MQEAVVFVHLNSRIPQFLIENLQTCVKIFPSRKIVLICDFELKKPIPGVYIFKIEKSQWNAYESNLTHPTNFRSNFWYTSIARFFAIEEYMKLFPDSPIIHIESDVILARDFPFNRFSLLSKELAFPVLSKERGIASTVFIRNKEAISKLVTYIKSEIVLNPTASDMTLLGDYFNNHPELVAPLAFGPPNGNAYLPAIPEALKDQILSNGQILGGIIDGNDFGLYFFGTDPRNLRGKSLFRRKISGSYSNIENWTMEFKNNREFPFGGLKTVKETYPVFSIHATCKDKKLFRVESQKQIIRKRIEKSQEPVGFKFYFWTFVVQVCDSVVRKLSLNKFFG
jgi:hypothetical protein